MKKQQKNTAKSLKKLKIKMRTLKYLLLSVLFFTSCKIKKQASDTAGFVKEMSAKKVVKKHIAANFAKNTLEAKFKVDYRDRKMKQSISVALKIKKDEVIWLKGTKFINIFKAKITPEKVRFYSSLEKTYFEGDFAMLQKLLGVEINFQQLQNLFLGQAMLDLKKEKQEVAIAENTYVLSSKRQANFFEALFAVNAKNFKLAYQSIRQDKKMRRLAINYPSYTVVQEEVFPKEIKINVKRGKESTTIDFTLKTIEFNTKINTFFSIPAGYKRIKL
ncbi:MAG: DUF4292 domain-containing protein [Flavobacteriales bacterium]|jgi:hypothetical protein|tara:strand:- start:6149 stop:6973 length:825 start_codon:yes stop_codon:yes gene_type:complete